MNPNFELLWRALPTILLIGGMYFIAAKAGNIFRAVSASAIWGFCMGFLMLAGQRMPLEFTNWRDWLALAGFAALGALAGAATFLRLENAARKRRALRE